MTAETDIAAIADAGDNTPGTVRTALLSTLARADNLWLPSAIGAYDDYFVEDTSADYTEVTPAGGTVDWNIRHEPRFGIHRGVSGIATDQSAGDVCGFVKSLSGITTGDYIQSLIRGVGGLSSATERRSFGFVLSSGAATSSSLAGIAFIHDSAGVAPVMRLITGTFDAITIGAFRYLPTLNSGLHVQITYSAASTFQVRLSLNGEDFWLPIEANITSAFTPTHGGWIVSSEGESIVSSAIHGSYFHSNVTP